MQGNTFDEVLDAIEHLPPDQQAEIIELVRRRLAEQGRKRVIQDVREARTEFAAGGPVPTSIDDIMRGIER